MKKKRIKHRWVDVGFGIKRCRRCKIVYFTSYHLFDEKTGYYKMYYSEPREKYIYGICGIDQKYESFEYYFVSEKDYVGINISCDDYIIKDLLE